MKKKEALEKYHNRLEVVGSAILDAVASNQTPKPEDVLEFRVCREVVAVLKKLEDVA